ncbi:hypothetical protein H10PHJ05_34 [Aeromonas phage HJ05]|nr:hypothetical protein H10PHJ05_34 [Aeromonas phage HJ05]
MVSLGKFEGNEVMAKQILARLVRGQVYYLGNKQFRAGVAVPVTKQERNHLEEFAVDAVTVSQGDDAVAEERPKFDFEETDEEDAPNPEGSDTDAGDTGAGDVNDGGASDAAQGNARGSGRARR